MAVARSLLGEPKVVLLDEPTAALGVAQTAQVLSLIKRLRERNLGAIVISHNLADVFEVADRIFVLRLGRGAGTSRPRKPPSSRSSGRSPERRSTTRPNSGGSHEDPPPACGRPVRAVMSRDALRRFLQGDLASLRVILAIAVIWMIFQLENDRFLSATNLTNLLLQITAVGLISVGVVYVLLLGEIDLSVGAVSGLCAAVMAVLNVKHGWSPYLAIAAGVAGRDRDRLRSRAPSSPSFRIPSFVVTLAGLLAWQGALLQVLGKTGTVNLTDSGSPTSPTPSTATPSAGSSRGRDRRLRRGHACRLPATRRRGLRRPSRSGAADPDRPGRRRGDSSPSRSSTRTAACRWRC